MLNDGPPPDPESTLTSATPPAGVAALPPPPKVPDHELLRPIGRGAYGEVWLARSVTGAFRAVKIVHRVSFDHDRPFEREFEGILKFEPISRRHDSQVDILHVGRANDCFYYVMELADDQATGGQIPDPAKYQPRTLKSDLLFRNRLPFEDCVQIGIALTTALEHLHAHGLVHRDVKPSNIIFVNGVAKLADIGLVTGVDATRSYVGTEGFAAPEGPGSPQADLYSLGKVLYEAATGKDRQEFPELPTLLRELPDREGLMELNAVIAKACRHDPKDRYTSAAAMRAELELLRGGRSLARLHRLQSQLRIVRRTGALVTALAAVIALGWWWQARQTQVVRELVKEKATLAEDKSRLLLKQEEELIRAYSATGSQRLEAEDPAAALPWLVEALRRLEAHQPAQSAPHRLRLGNILRYHPRLLNVFAQTGAVHTLAFSPDGQWLAAGGNDGKTQIISVQSSATPRWLGHASAVNSVEFSRDSRSLLTACDDGAARLWPLADSNAPVLLRHQDAVQHATFSPDGQRVLTASFDRTAQIWRARDGVKVGGPLEHGMPVFHASFSPDGTQIATGSGFRSWAGEFNVWTRLGDRWTAIPYQLSAPPTSTAFSPDGSRAAASCGEAHFDLLVSRPGALLDARTGALIRKLEHIDRITHVAFSPDGGRLAVATLGYEVMICDASTGKSLIPPLKHVRWVHRAVFSPDGRWVASASSDGTARVWDAATGVPVTPPLKHLGEIFCVAFDPSGRLLATAGDGGLVCLWDVGHTEPELPSMWYSPGELSATLTRDDRHIVTYAPKRQNATAEHFPLRGDEPVRVHDSKTGRLVLSCPAPGSIPFEALALSSSGDQLAIGSYDGWIRLWDLTSRRLRWELPVASTQSNPRAFSRDGQRVAICSYGSAGWLGPSEVRVLSTRDGQPLMPALAHPRPVVGITFGPDDRWLATACQDGAVRIWEIPGGRLIRAMEVYLGEVDEVRSSRDGRRLLTADKYNKTARLWVVASGELAFPPMQHTGIVWDATFDPTERRILTYSSDLTAVQWDSQTGERIDPPLRHQRALNQASYDSSGRLIATSSLDQTVRLWSADTGELLAAPFRYANSTYGAELTTDGRRLLASSTEGRVQIWDLATTDWSVSDLTRYAEALSTQSLSPDGRLTTLSAAGLSTHMAELRAGRPRDFEISTDQFQRWHRREKLDARGAGNTFAAEFHARRTALPDFE